MKITKRALAFLLAVVMLVVAFPIAVSTAAVEAEESSILDETATAYDKLYVQDGLVMLLSPLIKPRRASPRMQAAISRHGTTR